MAGISSIASSYMQAGVVCNAVNNVSGFTGADFSPITGGLNYNKKQTYGTSALNNALGGADEFVAALVTLTNGSASTINLSSLTNIVQQTAVALARVKGWSLRLLSLTDDTVYGTAAVSVTVGNSGTAPFLFNNWSSGATQTIYNGGVMEYFDQQAAGFVVTSGSNDRIRVLNNDTVNAVFEYAIFGGSS